MSRGSDRDSLETEFLRAGELQDPCPGSKLTTISLDLPG